ncbi:MAG TPA: hypothetical protein VKT76_01100 [Bradyrhizobium sp.]|nr:hypothetical protein [Bradyrhizobium sp.]
MTILVIASEAKQSRLSSKILDCFVALLRAMTVLRLSRAVTILAIASEAKQFRLSSKILDRFAALFPRSDGVCSASICLALDSISTTTSDLPVVPKCRSSSVLIANPNHPHDSYHPVLFKEGRIAIVTNVERGMRWTRMHL